MWFTSSLSATLRNFAGVPLRYKIAVSIGAGTSQERSMLQETKKNSTYLIAAKVHLHFPHSVPISTKHRVHLLLHVKWNFAACSMAKKIPVLCCFRSLATCSAILAPSPKLRQAKCVIVKRGCGKMPSGVTETLQRNLRGKIFAATVKLFNFNTHGTQKTQ